MNNCRQRKIGANSTSQRPSCFYSLVKQYENDTEAQGLHHPGSISPGARPLPLSDLRRRSDI